MYSSLRIIPSWHEGSLIALGLEEHVINTCGLSVPHLRELASFVWNTNMSHFLNI